jgi:murein L,D-transpeptidase YafK
MLRTIVSLIMAGALALFAAACTTGLEDGKANKPVSKVAQAHLEKLGTDQKAAMLVRIYKQENELEVWKQTRGGRYVRFKTYEICAWSGELGPKVSEGDRQAPEGFYTVTPGLMNPYSEYYLAFNLGFPNKFDKFHGRTGSNIMVHGDCSSAGCFAMTDDQISEIYALARETFKGGNRSFQVEVYPFKMTEANLEEQADSPNIEFWRNLKQGHDRFAANNSRPAQWDVCEGKYVFDADTSCAVGAGTPAGTAIAALNDSPPERPSTL